MPESKDPEDGEGTMAMKSVLTISLLAAFGLAHSAKAGNSDTSIAGTVRGSQGAAIHNAVIRIFDEGAKNAEGMTTADEHGSFHLKASDGLYDIFVSAPGFSPQCKRLQVKDGRTTTYTLKLRIDPVSLKERGDVF